MRRVVREDDLEDTTILIADKGAIRTITLNRPERRNAMTPQMQLELIAALEEAATSGCRVLVLRGAGEAFCAGLDLSSLQEMNTKTAPEFHSDAERIARLFRSLYELPLPTIAEVRGAAVGGGTGLATICDFTLAEPAAKFGYTEVRIGFVPALVSAFLALQIGDKCARAATKRLMAAQNKPWLDAAIALAMEASAQSRETADFSEGVAAFLEKRKPVWKE